MIKLDDLPLQQIKAFIAKGKFNAKDLLLPGSVIDALLAPPPTAVDLSYASGWEGTATCYVAQGRVFLDGEVSRTSGASVVVATFDSDYIPPAEQKFFRWESGSTTATITVKTNGDIEWVGTTPTSVNLTGINWRK